MGALNSLTKTNSLLSQSAKRLMTGKQNPTAASNPAAFAMARSLEKELGSQTQVSRNLSDGSSLASVADASLGEINNQLSRLSELSVQASSGTLSASDRTALNNEGNALIAEIDRLASTSEFNGIKLLDGNLAAGIGIQSGTSAGDQIKVSVADSRAAALGIAGNNNFTTQASSQAFIDTVKSASEALNSRRASLGATQNTLSSASSNSRAIYESKSKAFSQIDDVDFAEETAKSTKLKILQHANTSLIAQTANAGSSYLKFFSK